MIKSAFKSKDFLSAILKSNKYLMKYIKGILRLIIGVFLVKNLKKPPKKSENFTIKNIRKTKINLAFFLEKLKKTCSQNPPGVLFKLKKP